MNERSKTDERQAGAVPARRQYAKPRLERYGALSDLTQAVGQKNVATDGPNPPNNKTR